MLPHPPGHDDGAWIQAALQDLVPAYQPLASLHEVLVDAPYEPGLQRVLVRQILLPDAFLTQLAGAPPDLRALHQSQTLL